MIIEPIPIPIHIRIWNREFIKENYVQRMNTLAINGTRTTCNRAPSRECTEKHVQITLMLYSRATSVSHAGRAIFAMPRRICICIVFPHAYRNHRRAIYNMHLWNLYNLVQLQRTCFILRQQQPFRDPHRTDDFHCARAPRYVLILHSFM